MGVIFWTKYHSREKDVPLVASMIARHFPSDVKDFFRGEDIGDLSEKESSLVDLKNMKEGLRSLHLSDMTCFPYLFVKINMLRQRG